MKPELTSQMLPVLLDDMEIGYPAFILGEISYRRISFIVSQKIE
jgi:hypothetical protein